MPRSNSLRGGHAPGHIREAFISGLEDASGPRGALLSEALGQAHLIQWFGRQKASWWEGLDNRARAEWLVGQLWHCTDTLPGSECDGLDLPQGSSFAVAARKVRSLMNREPVTT